MRCPLDTQMFFSLMGLTYRECDIFKLYLGLTLVISIYVCIKWLFGLGPVSTVPLHTIGEIFDIIRS